MDTKSITTAPSLEELKEHGKSSFPFQTYQERYKDYPMENMSLHWHKELEFNIVLKGTVSAQVNGIHYTLQTGDAVFINSNILHLTKAEQPGTGTEHITIIFAPEFLSPKESDIYRDEIEPVLNNPSFGGFHLSSKIPWQREIIRRLSAAAYAHRHPSDGYKMQILSNLCSMWVLLKEGLTQEQHVSHIDKSIILEERTQKMLSYIHEHYFEPITIDDIAKAAQISRSECFRCFQKLVCRKPFEYLTSYRLTKAAELLKTTSLSVTEISLRCGFNYQSYFGKRFQEYYRMSPLTYRKTTFR